MKTLPTILVTMALASSAFANPKAAPPLPKEIQTLHALAGDWKSEKAVVDLGGKKRTSDVSISCSPTAGKMGLLCNTTFDVEGLGRVVETDLFGYDPGRGTYHWFAVTQRGDTHDHVALAPGPNAKGLTFVYSGYQDGKPMQEIITMTWLDAAKTRFELRNTGTVGGESAWTVAATFAKK